MDHGHRLRQSVRVASRLLASLEVSAGVYGAYQVERRLHPVDDLRRDRYVHLWTHTLLQLFNVQVRLDPPGAAGTSSWPRRRDLLPPGPRLVVSNHRSAIDILLMLDLFGGHMLARGDMAQWPGVGALAREAGTLFVDREGDSASKAMAIRRIRERLLHGRTVIVFPEGTTFPGDQVRPFHAGAFMAIGRSIGGAIGGATGHVVPVGIAYADEDAFFGDEPFSAHLKRLAEKRGTVVGVAVGQGIPVLRTGIKDLCAQAQERTQELVHRARQLV